MSGIAETRIF